MARRTGKVVGDVSGARQLFSASLKAELKRRGMTPPKIAKLSGISVRTIRNWLNMENDPQLSEVDKLAGSLGLTACQLLFSQADASAFRLWSVYQQATATGKDLIDLAVRSAEAEKSPSSQPGETKHDPVGPTTRKRKDR